MSVGVKEISSSEEIRAYWNRWEGGANLWYDALESSYSKLRRTTGAFESIIQITIVSQLYYY